MYVDNLWWEGVQKIEQQIAKKNFFKIKYHFVSETFFCPEGLYSWYQPYQLVVSLKNQLKT